jgi:hypothetical protein
VTEVTTVPTNNDAPPPIVALPTATPASTPVATAEPTVSSFHFLDQETALAAAVSFGCTGWTNETINNVDYYRICADDDLFEQLLPTFLATPHDPGSDISTSVPPTLASSTISPAIPPTSTVTLLPAATPPPYHYTSEAE